MNQAGKKDESDFIQFYLSEILKGRQTQIFFVKTRPVVLL